MHHRNIPWLACLIFLTASRSHAQEKLDRDRVLFYLDPSSKVQPVRNQADWEKRRAAIMEAMQSVMGPLPGQDKRCPLEVKVEEEVDCGTYLRRRISYQAEPGMRVPAYLLIPKTALETKDPVPAVLCLHPTHARGFRVTVGLANYPSAEYAVELAQRGYVCLAPPYPQLADYHPDLKTLGYHSGTMKAIWDNQRGLDLLDTLPYVVKGHYGTIGHSLGGHNSIYTAAFDKRLKIAVSCCGLDSYRAYMKGNIKGWTSERYMPKLWNYHDRLDQIPFDFNEILAVIAPRHVHIIAPKRDDNFRWESAARMAQSAAEVYELFHAQKHLQIEHPDCEHVFNPQMRAKAYQRIDEVLKK